MKKLNSNKDWRLLSRVLIGIWASMESHLLWEYHNKKKEKDRAFHRKVVKEYARMIKDLADVL